MSLNLKHLILHSLRCDASGALTLIERDSEIEASANAHSFSESLHLAYSSKSSKAFAYFDPEIPSLFKDSLQRYRNAEQDFLPFSSELAKQLLQQLHKHDTAEEGVLLIAEYEHLACDFLLVMVLEQKHSTSVNDQLEIMPSHYLETNSIQLAARIDLTSMERNPDSNRYVSFIRGRAGRKVNDFFVDFLCCSDGLDVKQQNTVLMAAVNDYIKVAELEPEQVQESRQLVKGYCEEQLKAGNDIQLNELVEQFPAPAEEDLDFYQFASDNYPLEEAFPAQRSELKKLTKYFGQGKGVSISFDQSLLNERIIYDEVNDRLTIQGLPPNLREQLKGNKQS
ncbi:nucleoid-associated protein YejK [Alginatibacterium sediminis]|nr:nucleoid-associated protein YejK [Alginatibacterium sediminis]